MRRSKGLKSSQLSFPLPTCLDKDSAQSSALECKACGSFGLAPPWLLAGTTHFQLALEKLQTLSCSSEIHVGFALSFLTMHQALQNYSVFAHFPYLLR